MTTHGDPGDPTPPPLEAGGERAADETKPMPGPMGRDRAEGAGGYYDRPADEGPGVPPAPGTDGRGGSMGGEASGDRRMMGEPARGARGQVAGDSQGGSLADGTAADSQPGHAD